MGGWSLGRLLGGGGLGWAYKIQEGWDGGEDEGDILGEMGLPNLRGRGRGLESNLEGPHPGAEPRH